MSDRLTKRWTDTAEQAFGQPGKKGREGELLVIDTLLSWGWLVEDHEDDREKQVNGIDISFKKPSWKRWYTGDVKANLRRDGTIPVYFDWLFRGQSDRIFHVNVDTGLLIWYDRREMQKSILGGREYKVVPQNEVPMGKSKAVRYDDDAKVFAPIN